MSKFQVSDFVLTECAKAAYNQRCEFVLAEMGQSHLALWQNLSDKTKLLIKDEAFAALACAHSMGICSGST